MIGKAAVLAAGLVIAAAAIAAPPIPDYLRKAVADPSRAADAKNDARRHVAEITAFAGIKPGDKVLELIPGGGYFTRVFSKVVGPDGHVYAVWPQPYDKESHPDSDRLRQLAKQPGYGNISVAIQPATQLTAPEPVDVVFTSQNYHDYPDKFMGRIDPAVLNRDVYAALKPGGVYVIVDHAAAAGSGMRDTDTLHRIDPAIVKKQVVAAGFVFDGESDVLRNPADDHTLTVFDKAIRGHTDQFVYRFHKPAR
ncbi:MAG: class I SAM-dependent methyltransferase [Proteobacteria bacterium]|nr:class I SAM-dependent methyltransferase [Pseudomonadota bacterium]